MRFHNWLSGLKTYRPTSRRRKLARTEPTSEPLEARALLATFTVTNTGDAGAGSLRQAIIDSNATTTEDDVIAFNIPGNGTHQIDLQSGLPSITDTVTIDGWTQPGFNGTPQIFLNGENAGASSGIIAQASGSTIRGIGIQNFEQNGILVNDASNLQIHGNYIGLGPNGIADAGNGQNGIALDFSSLQGDSPVLLFMLDTSASVSASFSGTPVGDLNSDGRSNTILDASIAGLSAAIDALNAQGLGNSVPIGVDNFDMDLVAPGVQLTTFAASDTNNNGVSDVIDILRRMGTTVDGIRYRTFHPQMSLAVDFFTTLNTPVGNGNMVVVSDGFISVDQNALTTLDAMRVNRRGIAVGSRANLGTMQRIDPEAVQVESSDELRDAALSIIAGSAGGQVQIGGDQTNQQNVIAFNGQAGVRIAEDGTSQVSILRNSIFSNGSLGIDLGPAGVTLNDFDDSDTGANQLVNYPRITSIVEQNGRTFVRGIIQAIPNTEYRIDLFSSNQANSSGYGEGQTFLESMTSITDPGGTGTFEHEFAGSINNDFLTATTTDPDGNTSEFSLARQRDAADPFADIVLDYAPLFGGGPAPTNPNASDPDDSLEKPDNQSVALGHGGRLDVEFVDNQLFNTGDRQFDLQIYESDSTDRIFVAARPTPSTASLLPASADPDGDGFYNIGTVAGGLSYIDIDAAFPGFAAGQLVFDAVQLTDDVNQGDPGALTPEFPLFVHDVQGNFATLDLSTGAVTVIGNLGVTLTDIAINSQGDIYGVSPSDLYRINPLTGVATVVGPTGVNTNALEFSSNDVLYAAGTSASLYTIDLQTGVATTIGNIGTGTAGDLAFVGNTLYAATADDQLIEIDLSSGVSASIVGPLGRTIHGLDSATGPLFGVQENRLYTINLSTGGTTELLDFSGQGLTDVLGVAFGVAGGTSGDTTLNEEIGADIDSVVALEFNSLVGNYIITPTGIGNTVSEAGEADSLSVRLAIPPEANVVINLSVDKPEQATIDRTSLTFTPADWDVPQFITVRAIDDLAADGNQAVDIVFQVSSNSEKRFAALDDKTATVLVEDNDAIGFLLSKTEALVSELATEDTFTLQLTAQPASDVVLELSSNDTDEVTVSDSSVTFTPINWNIPQTVTVTGVDDVSNDGDQEIPVSIVVLDSQSDNQFDTLPDQFLTVTVVDDDRAGLIVTQSGGSTASQESGTPDSFTVQLTTQPLSNVVVDIQSTDTSEATVGTDFITLTPQNWNTGVSVEVIAFDDVFVDGSHSVPILLSINDSESDNSYDVVPDQSFVIETEDDDEAGFILNQSSLSVSETGTSTFTILLTSAPLSDVVLNISSSDPGEAVVSPSQVIITPDNWGDFHTVTVSGTSDDIVDGPKDVVLRLTVDDEASNDEFDALADQVIDVVVTDSDIPGFTFAHTSGNTTVAEFGSSDSFTVQLTAQPEEDVVIGILASDGTEMIINRRRLRFTPGNWNLPQTVIVTGADDFILDGQQTSSITLEIEDQNSSPSFASVPNQTLQVKTLDNDVAGFAVSKTRSTVDEAGVTDTFDVTLTSRPQSNVNFTVSSGDTNEVTVSTQTIAFTPSNWNEPQTITLTATVDNINDGNQTTEVEVKIVPQTSDNKFDALNRRVVSVTTIDNDRARVVGPVGRIATTSPEIQITSVPNAVSHEIWLELIGSDQNPIANPTITGTTFTPENLAAGNYRTWVRANFASGPATTWHTADFSVSIPPVLNPVMHNSADQQPTLTWPAVAGATQYRVFANNLSARTTGAIDEIIVGSEFTPQSSQAAGRYRVWVQAIGNGVSTWSEPQEYTVGPTLTNPVHSTIQRQPQFAWSAAPGIGSYRLYVTGPDGFLLDFPELTDTSFTPDFDLADGDYHWWVQPQHVAGFTTEWTSRGRLTIGGKPQFSSPAGITTDGTPNLSWNPIAGAASYEIYFSHDASRRIIHRQTQLAQASWESFPVADGHYTAWVRSFDSQGNSSAWSEPHRIDVQAATVAITADPTSPTSPGFNTTPTFEWSVAGAAAEFDLHIWNGATHIIQEGLRTRSWTPDTALAAGEWQWAVRGINSAGQAGPWRFASTNTTGQTRLLSPIGQTTDQTPEFNWVAVTGASRYELQVENLNTSALVINESQLTTTTFVSPTNLPAGEYRAWVRTINSANNTASPQSVPVIFTIVEIEKLRALGDVDSLLAAVKETAPVKNRTQSQPPNQTSEKAPEQQASHSSDSLLTADSAVGIDRVMSDLPELTQLLSGSLANDKILY